MPLPTVHELERRFTELENKYLKAEIEKEERNELPDVDNIASFRLLFHAELEEFLERSARFSLDERESALSRPSYINPDADFILILAMDAEVKRTDGSRGVFDRESVAAATRTAISDAKQRLATNNGVRRDSMALIAVCCGFMPDGFDATLVNTLHSFGADRGDVAHKGVRRATTIRSPIGERATVLQILKQLSTSPPWSANAELRVGCFHKLVALLRQLKGKREAGATISDAR